MKFCDGDKDRDHSFRIAGRKQIISEGDSLRRFPVQRRFRGDTSYTVANIKFVRIDEYYCTVCGHDWVRRSEVENEVGDFTRPEWWSEVIETEDQRPPLVANPLLTEDEAYRV